jgi:hypothetical protein
VLGALRPHPRAQAVARNKQTCLRYCPACWLALARREAALLGEERKAACQICPR